MNWFIRLIFVALLSFGFSGGDAFADCGDCPGDKTEEAECDKSAAEKASACGCSKAKEGGSAWCDHCNVGHHDGKKMKCKSCFDKATGKSTEDCKSCAGKKAKAADGEKEG